MARQDRWSPDDSRQTGSGTTGRRSPHPMATAPVSVGAQYFHGVGPRCPSSRQQARANARGMSPAATARNTVLSGGDTSNSIGSRNPARPAATANPITTPRAARTIASRTTIPTRLLRLAVAAHRVLPETLRGHRSKKSPLKRSGEREPKRLWGQHMWRGPGLDRECPPRHHPGSGNREKEVS